MSKDSILIVEDEILVAKNLQNILVSQGYYVPFICDNGNDAIEKARELGPSLVLMDIMIKGKNDGIDTADYLYSRMNIPVVFLTAYGDENTLDRAKSAEPYGYLLKPISDGILYTTIEIAIQKHRLENKVRENEELLSIILKSMDTAIFVINKDMTVNFTNQAAVNLLSKKQNSVVGKHIKDLLNFMEMEKPLNIESLIKNARNKNEKFEFFTRIYLQMGDGSKIPVEGSIMPLWRDPASCILLILRDISSLKKIEAEMLRFEKLESLSILAGGIAHDFNNMLTVIIGKLAFCRQKDISRDELDAYLEESENACLKAKELTHQLMTFSKSGFLNIKSHNIKKMLLSVAFFIMHGSEINVEFKLPENLPNAAIDETQIEQVMQNIIINAREAMPKDGTLTISAEKINFNDELAESAIYGISSLKKGNYIKIIITDNGPGISESDLIRIFDPYFTTKPNGTGLGLSTSYNIIKNHGGIITVESEPGKGTSFTIYIPVSDGDIGN